MSIEIFDQKALAVVAEEFKESGKKREFEISQERLDKINRIYILSSIINIDNFVRLADIITHFYNVDHVTISIGRNSLDMPILEKLKVYMNVK